MSSTSQNSLLIKSILNEAEVLYLAMQPAQEDDFPYIVPVNFICTDNSVLYFHSRTTGKKIDYLKNKKNIAFSTAINIQVQPERATTTFKSVCGTGKIQFIEDEEEKIFVLTELAKKYHANCSLPPPPNALSKTTIIKINIQEITGRDKV